MTESTKLLELAERCERASGSARELAATIAKAIGWRPKEGEPGSTTSAPWAWCPDFTASLDAAMQLVPIDYTIQLSDWDSEQLRNLGPWQAIVLPRGMRGSLADMTFTNRCDHAATPALALTAACLRARATLKETPNAD